jgi:hypothetical protein
VNRNKLKAVCYQAVTGQGPPDQIGEVLRRGQATHGEVMDVLDEMLGNPRPGYPRPISKEEMSRAQELVDRARERGERLSWASALEQVIGNRNPAPAVTRPGDGQAPFQTAGPQPEAPANRGNVGTGRDAMVPDPAYYPGRSA